MSNENTGRFEPVPSVVVDIFERGSGVPAALQRLGAHVSLEPLATGDYRIGGGIVVERKTIADFHGSLGRGRLWAQVGKVRDEAVTPILLVEGDDLDAGPRHPNAVRGALLAVFELGVGILWSRDPGDSALWLHRLAVRHERKARTRRPLRASEVPEPGIEVLAAVPGISTRTARALLERFGSVGGLLHAGPDQWAEVDGIGSARAHALATALLEGTAVIAHQEWRDPTMLALVVCEDCRSGYGTSSWGSAKQFGALRESTRMRLVVDAATVAGVITRLSAGDRRRGEDARAAVEWLTAGDEGSPAVFTRRQLQLFLWYELPRKWVVDPDEHIEVAGSLAVFFDELGPGASPLAAMPANQARRANEA